jgi:hypothetical protein
MEKSFLKLAAANRSTARFLWRLIRILEKSDLTISMFSERILMEATLSVERTGGWRGLKLPEMPTRRQSERRETGDTRLEDLIAGALIRSEEDMRPDEAAMVRLLRNG